MTRKPIPEEFRLNTDALAARLFEPYAHQFVQKRSFDEENRKAAESFGQKGRDWTDFGSVLASLTQNPLWKTRMALARLYDDWTSIVGDSIARNSRVGRLRGGELSIIVNSPAWANTISFMSEAILEKLHTHPATKDLDIRSIKVIGGQNEPYKRRRY
ncbi:DUF721 domain-containing protein [Alloscardovia macacae]|uniref:DUF721 domain-containing protein n=1 Tax=Alloscardovia macacae TaxID=1160091 RepID=A0A261F6I3_9BIFI|nr:DUF721 domain-containing protein [Alloscardovia macacae]OZG54741.1 hypothetical protein ALMA_0066 [Alloscardovia macacae]